MPTAYSTQLCEFQAGRVRGANRAFNENWLAYLDQELELSSGEVAFDIHVENQIKAKRDYGGDGEEGHLRQRKCSREMRDQQRGNMKISGAILGKYKMS